MKKRSFQRTSEYGELDSDEQVGPKIFRKMRNESSRSIRYPVIKNDNNETSRKEITPMGM